VAAGVAADADVADAAGAAGAGRATPRMPSGCVTLSAHVCLHACRRVCLLICMWVCGMCMHMWPFMCVPLHFVCLCISATLRVRAFAMYRCKHTPLFPWIDVFPRRIAQMRAKHLNTVHTCC